MTYHPPSLTLTTASFDTLNIGLTQDEAISVAELVEATEIASSCVTSDKDSLLSVERKLPMDQIMDQIAVGKGQRRNLNEKERIEGWLRQYGFDYNPFAYSNSERDYRLSDYFVEYPDFEKTIGFNNRLIFARPGDGKTAIRLRLQTFYRDSFADHHVFAFSYLISQEIAKNPPRSIEGHMSQLLTAAVRHAFIFLALRGVELSLLQNPPLIQSIAHRFAAFFDEYYGLVNSWQEDLRQAILTYSLEQILENLAPVYDDLEPFATIGMMNTQWLQIWLDALTTAVQTRTEAHTDPLPVNLFERWEVFCKLLGEIGIQQVLILVDGVDIKPASQLFPHTHLSSEQPQIDRMVAIIKPLIQAIENRRLGNSVYWKLFLPLELYLSLVDLLSFGIQYDIIEWDRKQLLQLIRSRLSSASNRAITSLNQLVAKDVLIDLELYLCASSDASPRYLIYDIHKIFASHVGSHDQLETIGKISRNTLSKIRYISHHQISPGFPP